MKRRWQRLAARIDALTLRERVLLFAAVAATMVLVAHVIVLGPMFKKQAALRAQISQQQNNLAGIDGEITQKVQAYQIDPDAPTRERIAAVKAETVQLGESLRAMQKGLVAPERIALLLDTILRANGRLKLVSMKTLAPGSVGEPAPGQAAKPEPPTKEAKLLATALTPVVPAAAAASAVKPAAAMKPLDLLYRHGVELTVRGNYLDMIDYMHALEAMPTQLFWGKALLDVEDYPGARLTLTLYTLSLDPKWMKL